MSRLLLCLRTLFNSRFPILSCACVAAPGQAESPETGQSPAPGSYRTLSVLGYSDNHQLPHFALMMLVAGTSVPVARISAAHSVARPDRLVWWRFPSAHANESTSCANIYYCQRRISAVSDACVVIIFMH